MVDRPSRSNPLSELVGEFPGRLRGDRWQPAVDVFETEKSVVVRVELSGVHSSQVKVSVEINISPGGASTIYFTKRKVYF